MDINTSFDLVCFTQANLVFVMRVIKSQMLIILVEFTLAIHLLWQKQIRKGERINGKNDSIVTCCLGY